MAGSTLIAQYVGARNERMVGHVAGQREHPLAPALAVQPAGRDVVTGELEAQEPVGPLAVQLTPEGEADPLFAGVPTAFAAYGGHKEGLARLPVGAVSLATSEACPVQAFRVGHHVYATQFHPELDLVGVCTRIEVYKDAGYFDPREAETLKELSRAVEVTHPMTVLGNFVQRYR